MSFYTTGELAKLCKVSVRTVQYYNERGILIPTDLSEGGRRLFSDEDVKTLETICFLRDLDISIKDIAEILESEESKNVIGLLLEQQVDEIQKELKKKADQLDKIKNMQSMLNSFNDASQKSIHDISMIMGDKKRLKSMYGKMIAIGAPLEAIEIAAFVIGIVKGIWFPFFIVMGCAVVCVYFLFNYWHARISFICPECHKEFKAKKLEAFFGNHTPRTRKLTCPCCNKKIWCLELYKEEID